MNSVTKDIDMDMLEQSAIESSTDGSSMGG